MAEGDERSSYCVVQLKWQAAFTPEGTFSPTEDTREFFNVRSHRAKEFANSVKFTFVIFKNSAKSSNSYAELCLVKPKGAVVLKISGSVITFNGQWPQMRRHEVNPLIWNVPFEELSSSLHLNVFNADHVNISANLKIEFDLTAPLISADSILGAMLSDLTLSDVTLKVRAMVSYMYASEEAEEAVSENLKGVLGLADKYDLQSLKEFTVDLLEEQVDESPVAVAELALLHNVPHLLKNCAQFVENNFKEVKKNDDWKTLGERNVEVLKILTGQRKPSCQ